MSVIDNLVKNKKGGAKNIDWDVLKTQNLYLLEITIKIGKQSIRMEGSDIGLDEEICDKLSQLARGGYSAKLGLRFKKASSKLHSLQKTFYKTYTTYFNPFRFVSEPDLIVALEYIESIKMEAEELRNDFIENYDKEMKEFLKSIETILKTAKHNKETIVECLSRYASLYPTKDDLKGCFQILVEGPTKLNTISEHIMESCESTDQEIFKMQTEFDLQKKDISKKYDKKLANEKINDLTKHFQSKKKNLNIVYNANENYASTLIDAVNNVKIKSKDEAYDLIAELIDRYGLKRYSTISETKHGVFKKILSRLKVLSEHENSLKPIIKNTEDIHNNFINDDFDIFLRSFSLYFIEINNYIHDENTGSGYEKLTLYIKNNDLYFKLMDELYAIKESGDLKKLKGLIKECKRISNIYKFRIKPLEQLFLQAKKSAQNLVHSNTDVFDI